MSRLAAVVWLAQGLLDLALLWAVARHTHPIVRWPAGYPRRRAR